MFDLARTGRLITGALFDSEATWRSYLSEAGDWKKTATLLTGPLIVAAGVLGYVIGFLGADVSLFGLRPTLGSALLGIVLAAIAATVVAFIFSALAAPFGGKQNFALGLAATTLAFVPGYAGQALSGLPWVGWLLSIALAIYGLVLLWRIIPLYLEVPQGKRAPHYIVSLLACIIVGLVISTVVGRTFRGDPAMGRVSTTSSTQPGAVGGGLFGGLTRQAELIAAADEDRYEPPRDGLLSERQVEEFVRVMERVREASIESGERLQEIAERAENEQVSFRDLGAVVSGMREAAGLSTVELEIVKSAGGNWAEHQWVKQTLRTAWLEKDANETVARNYALYQAHEDKLREFIVE
jgi:Yip1 domain